MAVILGPALGAAASGSATPRNTHAGERPTLTPAPAPTPAPTASTSVRVTSIPALLAALDDNAVTEIVVADGTYRVSPAAAKASDSLWIGARYADRTRAVVVRAATTGGVTFDGGGGQLGGITFVEGAHHQTWQGFRFTNGSPKESGVIVFGGYEGMQGAHHITLRDISIDRSVADTTRAGHVVYFSHSKGGAHDILIDGFDVDLGGRGVQSALHFYHSEHGNMNVWNVTVRNMHVAGADESAIMLWDATIRNVLIEDSTISGSGGYAVHYELGGTVTLRRVISTGSGRGGFYSSLGTSPDGVTFIDTSLR